MPVEKRITGGAIRGRVVLALFLAFFAYAGSGQAQDSSVLAYHRSTDYHIVVGESASEVEQFGASELRQYLGRMTGADFPVVRGAAPGKTIRVGAAMASAGEIGRHDLGFDGFLIESKPGDILLAGVNDRGTLFAVYAFLEELGCRWFAPNFAFYGPAGGEVVPQTETLRIPVLTKVVRPSLKYRNKDISTAGPSYPLESVRQLIAWMPKVGLNVLRAPINYEGLGIGVWDSWRQFLIPELKKRGLLLELGGHGYENFLPASRYFRQHPEWFGLIDGKRTPEKRAVFETSDPEAVAEFVRNIESYVRAHPEIDIFDLWAPDSALWSESPESVKLGGPSQRQALLVNVVARMFQERFPRALVEFNAYTRCLLPPVNLQFAPNTMVDFSPAFRSYQTTMWDDGNAINREYSSAIQQWLNPKVYAGDVSLYTYYSKEVWRSLPVVIPNLIAQETRHYAEAGLRGIGMYSDPANWFTYELNHYFLARASMNANINVQQALIDYAQERFGPAALPVREYFQLIEDTVPNTCRLVGTTVKNQEDIEDGLRKLDRAALLLRQAESLSVGPGSAPQLVAKLQISLRYATNDLRIRLLAWHMAQLQADADNFGEVDRAGTRETADMVALLKERRDLFKEHQGEGVFDDDPAFVNFEFSPRKKP